MEPLRNRPQLSDEAASYVRELIMSGRVPEGAYLRLDKLASELGMSATPIREGLVALRGEGFVRLEPRRGFVVQPLTRQDVEDLYLVQATLAGELAARAATRIDAPRLAEVEQLQAALEEAQRTGDAERVETLNHQFHREINLAAGSPKLAWFLGSAARYAPRRFYPTIHGWPEASVEDHHAVIEALRKKDEAAAGRAMREHIQHAGQLLVAHLSERHNWT